MLYAEIFSLDMLLSNPGKLVIVIAVGIILTVIGSFT